MISFIVPTVGRRSLSATLDSIECWPGDEILIVGTVGDWMLSQMDKKAVYRFIPCAPGNDFGHSERNLAMPLARGDYIAHIDDDDIYVPGTRALMANVIQQTPGRPALFRMCAPNGVTLWREQRIYCGNVGTPQILMPNKQENFGTWGSFVGGDCHFLETCKWKEEEYVWRPEIICLVGHNWG